MRRILIAMTLGVVATFGSAATAGAGTVVSLGDMTVDPDSGPAGTTFSVSGEDCLLFAGIDRATKGGAAPFFVEVWFEAGSQTADAAAVGGSWNQEFTVPDGTEPGVYKITATCYYGDPEQSRLVGSYNDGEFTVTEPPTTTTVAPTTTTVAPTTTTVAPTTTAAPTTTVAPATSAAAVVAELPRTGGDPTALLAIGAASIGGGLSAFAVRRRGRSRARS